MAKNIFLIYQFRDIIFTTNNYIAQIKLILFSVKRKETAERIIEENKDKKYFYEEIVLLDKKELFPEEH